MAKPDSAAEELERLREERKRAEDHLAACTRLTAIGQLTAGVAHELNNPLSVILGFAQSLAQQFANQEGLQSSLKIMEREALRCKHLVQDLLNFSRLPRPGKLTEDAAQILEGALSLVEAQARIQQAELIREFDDSLPMIYADRHRIQQMIINLCTNAMDAMPKGGKLTVGLKRVVTGDAEAVEIRVQDTGTGIPPQIRGHIFEPFFTTKEVGKGTGLGLSLVRQIVEDHEAHIDLESIVGGGTIFTVRIPARLGPANVRETGDGLQKTSS